MTLSRPYVDTSQTIPALMDSRNPASRLVFKGMSYYAAPEWSNSTIQANYDNRVAAADAMKNWGVNLLRLRVMGNWYGSRDATGKALYIQQIKDWRDLCAARGIYLMLCDFDLTSQASGNVPWSAAIQTDTKNLYQAIFAALGDDPGVIYEPYNEPNQDTYATWQAYMKDMQDWFRNTLGYKGVLVIDPLSWAMSSSSGGGFSETDFTAIETYDASLPGMNGKHQIVFAKHDYAKNWTNNVFNAGTWITLALQNSTKHVFFQTEFGNISSSISDPKWTETIAGWMGMAAKYMRNYCGATAFQWFWTDNSLTAADRVTPTVPYGQRVKDFFVASTPKADPTSLPSLHAWWKADAITGVANNAALTTWPDSSGNGRDATQATAAAKPIYQNNVQGPPAVHFPGTGALPGQYMTTPATASFDKHGLTIFAVVALGAFTSNQSILGPSGAGGVNLRFNGVTGKPEGTLQTTGSLGIATNAIPLFQWNLIGLDFQNGGAGNGAAHHYLNGAANGTTSTSIIATTGLTMFIGNYYSLNSIFNGWISEIIIYERVLNGLERQIIETYLDNKYGAAYRVGGSPSFGSSNYIGRNSVRKSGTWKRFGASKQTRKAGAWGNKPMRLRRSGLWTPA